MAIDYDDMMQSGATGLVSRYDEKDVMLYALGVGFMRDPLDEKELPFAYENNGLKVVPTFASVISRGEAPPALLVVLRVQRAVLRAPRSGRAEPVSGLPREPQLPRKLGGAWRRQARRPGGCGSCVREARERQQSRR